MTTITLNESGFDTGMTFADYCALAAQHGDNPAQYSDNPADFVFVSKSYAQADPDWDVDEDWPDSLPVWEYRPDNWPWGPHVFERDYHPANEDDSAPAEYWWDYCRERNIPLPDEVAA